MKFKSLFLVILYSLYCNFVFTKERKIEEEKQKILFISGIGLAATSSYLYLENVWWSDEKTSFTFDNGADSRYALNLDKFGHFMGGMIMSDIASQSMIYLGENHDKAIWKGAVIGSAVQLGIEIKDAYAPYWGFSKWDLAFGSLGAFWPVAQHYHSDFRAINFKFSYWKRSSNYEDLQEKRGGVIGGWHDDYPNQTYWIVFDVNHFVEVCCWPEWLNIGVGFGIDDKQTLDENYRKKGGNHEWYITLDYNMEKLLKKWEGPTAKNIKKVLNYVHFPAPAIRISPKLAWYPLFL